MAKTVTCIAAHPNVTVPPPRVTTGFHDETFHSQEHNLLYTYHTVQFQCGTNIEAKYTYDVRWYIDDFEIIDAAHTNVVGHTLSVNTMLRQHHWEQLFKPNMMVLSSYVSQFIAKQYNISHRK